MCFLTVAKCDNFLLLMRQEIEQLRWSTSFSYDRLPSLSVGFDLI